MVAVSGFESRVIICGKDVWVYSSESNPLVLTALVDEKTQHYFDGLRRAHFPPERNVLDAHVTLFHALPAAHESVVVATLEDEMSSGMIDVQVTKIVPLGGGVAFRLESVELAGLRGRLVNGWRDWLTPQDLHKRELHVTVQNKVSPEVARQLQAELEEGFEQFSAVCTGLGLWRYMGGPWAPVRRFLFGSG